MKRISLPACLLIGALTLSGCGGSGSGNSSTPSSGQPSLKITIHWPGKTRLIPAATEMIDVKILAQSDGSQVTDVPITAPTITQPSTSISTIPMPVGTFIAKATAQASGSADLAEGTSQPFTTHLSQTATFTVTMNSNIDHITVNGGSTLAVGDTVPMSAQALDSSGATVLLTPSKLEWSSETASVATVDAQTGVVTGVAEGTASIDVQDTESKKVGKLSVTVTPAVLLDSITISPAFPTVKIGQTVQFKVTGKDADGNVIKVDPSKVTWSASGTNLFGTAVANIDAKSGLATAVAHGDSLIAASVPTIGGFGIPITVSDLTTLDVSSPSIVGTWTTNYGSTGVETYVYSSGGTVSDSYGGHTYTGHYTYADDFVSIDNSAISFGGGFSLAWIDINHCQTTYFDGSTHIWSRG